METKKEKMDNPKTIINCITHNGNKYISLNDLRLHLLRQSLVLRKNNLNPQNEDSIKASAFEELEDQLKEMESRTPICSIR